MRQLANPWWQRVAGDYIEIGLTAVALNQLGTIRWLDGPVPETKILAAWPCVQIITQNWSTDLIWPVAPSRVVRRSEHWHRLNPAIDSTTVLLTIEKI